MEENDVNVSVKLQVMMEVDYWWSWIDLGMSSIF